MLKTILRIKSVQKIEKKQQAEILGGMQYLCEETCNFGYRKCYTSKTEFFYQPCYTGWFIKKPQAIIVCGFFIEKNF